jgi:Fe-S oxidoreductase
VELVEMERCREAAWCCGAGGGVREAYPEFSAWTASERVEEARATGADAIVTACPWCERNFLDAQRGPRGAATGAGAAQAPSGAAALSSVGYRRGPAATRGTPLQVLDVMDLVRRAL